MKKFFSLFAAVLFAGSMMADVVVKLEKIGTELGSTANTEVATTDITATGTTDSYTLNYYQCKKQGNSMLMTKSVSPYISNKTPMPGNIKSVKLYINTGASGKTTYDVAFGTSEFTTATAGIGAVNITAGNSHSFTANVAGAYFCITLGNANNGQVLDIEVVCEGDDTTPVIGAANVDFGTNVIADDEESLALDTNLVVTGINLTEAIVAEGSEHVTVNGTLTAEGGTLNLHIVAAAGDFSEVITLTSGETVKEVTVSGTIKKEAKAAGTPAVMTANGDTKSYEASVDGTAGVKVGTGSVDGSFTVTVPAGAIKLNFFGAAWNNAAGNIAISAPEGVTLSLEELDLVADPGISGTSNDYFLQNLEPADCLFSIDLEGVEAETLITFASGTARRFVIWGAAYEIAEGPGTGIEETIAAGKAAKIVRDGQLLILKGNKTFNAQGAIVK